jgi:hypothetical protein
MINGHPVIPVYKQQRARLCVRPAIRNSEMVFEPVVWWRRLIPGKGKQDYYLHEFDGRRCWDWGWDK